MKFLSKPTDSEGNTLATEKYVDKAVSSGSGTSTDIDDLKNMIYPTLEVSTNAEYEITFSCGDRIITATPDNNNTVTKKLPLLGTWTVYSTLSDGSYFKTIDVTTICESYSVEIIYPTLKVKGVSGCEITFTCGDVVLTDTPNDDTVYKKLPFLGTWTIVSTIDGVICSKEIDISDANKIYYIGLARSIYGVIWDGSSTSKFTRTDDSVDFSDPVPALGGTGGSSPFDEFYPWCDIEKVTIDDNVMVKIPKFWYKITKDGNSLKFQIADKAVDGFNVSPAHADRGDGAGERDYVYIGRYKCNYSYKSITKSSPIVNVTKSKAINGIISLGSGYYMQSYSMFWTVRMLYLVEFADWNSQAVIGYGCGDGSSVVNTGTTDSMSYHTGTMKSSRTTYGTGVQYRWIEDPWGNVSEWCDKVSISYNWLTVSNPDNTRTSVSCVNSPSSGYISQWLVSSKSGYEWALYPSITDGSADTYITDYFTFNNNNSQCIIGGNYTNSRNTGLFSIAFDSSSNLASGSLGTRLQYLP